MTAMPVPFDIKLMNLTAAVLFSACLVLLLAAGAWWAVRHPAFAIAGIAVQGDTVHSNVAMLRTAVLPKLAGNFFTINLAAAREAFEAVPWVRKAVVRREFPNRLRVHLQEQRAVALWGEEDGETRLMNDFGEVFEADDSDAQQDRLPRLSGPDAQSPQVLAMYWLLKPLFEPLNLELVQMTLTVRGSWQVELDNGAAVELGRGTPEEVVSRTRQFVGTLTQVTSRYGRRPDALISADLRHANGYAMRLRGVVTTGADASDR
jgi:cell division protein FtsQ